jgi:hypothetical protein
MTKFEIDEANIVNYCGVSAKNSHGKISSYHLTIRKPYIEALGISSGDTVNVAILKVNKGFPTSEVPPGITPPPGETPAIASVDSPSLLQESPPGETKLQETPGKKLRHSTKATRGEKGKSKRGKGGSHKVSRRRKAS